MSESRTKDLLAAVDHALSAWRTWRDDPQANSMTPEFADAIADCLTLWDEGTIPGTLRQLQPLFVELKQHWNRWVSLSEQEPARYPVPGRSFWASLEALELAQVSVQQPKEFTVEPIDRLEKAGVSDQQICRMYGFTDNGMPDGNPIIRMLNEERAKPGTHTGPESGWMPPHARRQKAIEAQQRQAIEKVHRAAAVRVKVLTEPAKETIEELVSLGCAGKQIAKMKKISRQDLAGYCKQHGLAEPPWEQASANATSGQYDRPGPEVVPMGAPPLEQMSGGVATSSHGDEIEDEVTAIGAMTLEQQIIMYHQAGLEPAAIAERVSEPGNEISHQKVGKVIARWKVDRAAFETAGA